ncbi:PR domain zinc finger protein 2 [Triplophysa dalaica]|uniref:PR domain zinc finger protein 2 n=1 Tax=Triplophysa dalaica TaxID=1582913 RepID=UPI0024DF972D|nr:PR domain zinc finger protein 2 [Triplophysa dalaica]
MATPGGAYETMNDIPAHVWRGLPNSMKLGPSAVDPNRIGVWASRLIPKGKRFGPFVGERKKRSQVTSNVYMWEVYFPAWGWMCVDATDPMKGNWMRYVNWARSSQEQNLFPLEINRAIYYKVLRPIGPDEELLVWYNGEDNPEIAAALEEERTSSLNKKSSPKAKRARRKLSERSRLADLGGFCDPSATESSVTEMRDSEEGLNGEERTVSPSELQQENPPSQSSSTEEQNQALPDAPTTEMDQTEELDEENTAAEGHEGQVQQSNQSPNRPSEAESVDGNEKSDLQMQTGSLPEDDSESPLCDIECGSYLANPELEAEGEFEDDAQGGTYPCQHCERHFSTKQGLERHAHIHTTSNHQTHTFKCRYCTKPFGSQVGRRRHERRHENGSKTLNRPGSLAGTAFLHSPSAPNDSATSSSVSSPSQATIMSPQNGPPHQSSDSLKKEPGTDSYRSVVVEENGESRELHPCKYCNKAFGTHTNMRRHQRRIHERHLMPKGVRKKGMLMPDGSSQQQHQHQQSQSAAVQEESSSASPPPVYVPSVDTEDEREKEDCMVDISNNISENLSHYIDGKIQSTSTVSNCEVIEVDSRTAALFGLDALILNQKPNSHALKVEMRTCPVKDVSCASQSVSRRRTATPPLLPAVKVEPEAASSSSSLSSPSSQSPLLVGNIFPQSTDMLGFQKEKTVYLSPKLKQLLQAPDGQKPAIGLVADSHRLTTPLTVTSLPAVQGRFKRRTASPPTTVQTSPSQRNDSISNTTGVSCSLKVPKIESHCVSIAWSPSSQGHGDAMNLTGNDGSPSRSGGNSCNQQPLDLSNSISKKDNTASKSTGEAVLDLSMSRKSVVDEMKTSSAILPHVKRKKPNTSILEKVLMNEYAGLSSPEEQEEGSNSLESPDALSPSESATCMGPSSPGSERLPCESTSPPSLTPMTINPSSPSSSSVASSTPPPPVLPSVPSPPPFASHHVQMSDIASLSPFPVLSPEMSPKAVDHSSEEVSETANLTDTHHDALNPNELDQTAEQLDTAVCASPQDTKRHCKAESSSKSQTLLEGSTNDTKPQLLKNADEACCSHSERDTACETSQSRSSEGTLPQDLDIKTEGRPKSKSSHSTVQSTPKKKPLSTTEVQSTQKTIIDYNLVEEVAGKKEEPDDVSENGDGVSASPGTPARNSSYEELETPEKETFAKSFVCNVCKEPFRSIKDLSGHIIEHASEWPFKCEFCVQLFGNATALLEHRSSLHGVGRIYICSVCSKEFAFLCNLNQHQSDLHPSQACTHTAVENGKLRPQNYTDPAQANVEKMSSDTIADSTAGAPSPDSSEEQSNSDTRTTGDKENGHEDPTEELYTTIKIMASEAGKPKGPDVRLGINQHYPSFKPPPFPYHNHSPDGSVASATHFTTHNIPQTFSTAIRCTKCGNSFDNMPELHKHILVCANASDKKRYTPKKNPIPLKQIVKQSPNGVPSTTVAAVGQNAFRRMGQPKRLNFNQDISSKSKLTSLSKKKNQLIQKAIFQKNKTAASAMKSTTQVKQEETHKVHMCPYCSREFTYPASLNKHIACSCPQRPIPKKLKKGALTPQDKNMNLRSRATDSEIKQETGSGPGTKILGKTRAQSSEPVESEAKPLNKGKSPQVRTKRPALNPDAIAPQIKKGKKSNDPQTSITPVLTDDHLARPQSKMQRGPKDVAVKKEAVVTTSQSKKEDRFSVRTRERMGGPVTRSAQMASASTPVEVKTEEPLNPEPELSEESVKLAR